MEPNGRIFYISKGRRENLPGPLESTVHKLLSDFHRVSRQYFDQGQILKRWEEQVRSARILRKDAELKKADLERTHARACAAHEHTKQAFEGKLKDLEEKNATLERTKQDLEGKLKVLEENNTILKQERF